MRSLSGNTDGRVAPLALAVVLCAVQFVDVLGVTVVITALPSMLGDLGAGAGLGTLVVTGYAACFGGLLMLASRLGDRTGHRRLLLAAIGLFAAASLIAATAGSVWVLAAGRALQGVAAAASVPSALRLLTTLVPEGDPRRRAVAGWSAAGAAAGAAGFVVGGVVSQGLTWRALFWLNVAVAVVLIALVVRVVPGDGPADRRAVVPWGTAAWFTMAATALVAGPTAWTDHGSARAGLAALAVGLAGAVGFGICESRSPAPLVPPVARRSTRIRWGSFGSFANTATTSSSITVATLHLQGELGRSPVQAGATLVGFSLLVIVGSAAAPALMSALGWGRTLGLGLAVVTAGNATLVLWPSVVGIAAAGGLAGLGIGIGSVAATDMGTHVAEDLKATAAGILNTAAQLGTALGTSVALLVATLIDDRAAWLVVTAVAAAATVAVLSRSRRGPSARSAGRTHRRRPPTPGPSRPRRR